MYLLTILGLTILAVGIAAWLEKNGKNQSIFDKYLKILVFVLLSSPAMGQECRIFFEKSEKYIREAQSLKFEYETYSILDRYIKDLDMYILYMNGCKEAIEYTRCKFKGTQQIEGEKRIKERLKMYRDLYEETKSKIRAYHLLRG